VEGPDECLKFRACCSDPPGRTYITLLLSFEVSDRGIVLEI
jgi:hypothetical protein